MYSYLLLFCIYVLAHANANDCGIPSGGADVPQLRVGVFLQASNYSVWPDMYKCLSNVVEVQKQSLAPIDVHVSFARKHAVTQPQQVEIESSVRALVGKNRVYALSVENVGADIGQFLEQIRYSEGKKLSYDVLLKIHSKTNKEWRTLGISSLCGSVLQVRSILHNFKEKPGVDMIAPAGTIFYVGTSMDEVAPVISKSYWQGSQEVPPNLMGSNIPGMTYLQSIISPDLDIKQDSWSIVAGSMFWVRYDALRPKAWAAALEEKYFRLTRGYIKDKGLEHAIERFLPTLIENAGGQIATMPPAPRPFAIYFPQYHRVPENDRFWGDGFTEWTLLKPFQAGGIIKKPLSVEKGGLGYYNLEEKEVRRCQGMMARHHGVQGFMYYHYWFTDPTIGNKAVMDRIPSLVLEDGEPNLPFFFSWANEPWSRRWDGGDATTMIAQNYGGAKEWREHAEYLMRFFKNEKYVKKDGKPAFVIYRPGHMKEYLIPMMKEFDSVAREHGFPGIYFINTVGSFYNENLDQWNGNGSPFPAAFHFIPTAKYQDENYPGFASVHDMNSVVEKRQFWGASSGFDAIVRRKRPDAVVWPPQPIQYQEALSKAFSSMGYKVGYEPDELANLFFLAAWNEWNEQCVLEPDDHFGFAYLQALKNAIGSIEARLVSKGRLRKDNFNFVFNGTCRSEAPVATELAGSLLACVNKAFEFVGKSVSYISYSIGMGECLLFSGKCATGEKKNNFQTYKLKGPFVNVAFTVKNLKFELLSRRHSHLLKEAIDSSAGGITSLEDVRMYFLNERPSKDKVIVQAIVVNSSAISDLSKSATLAKTVSFKLQHDLESDRGNDLRGTMQELPLVENVRKIGCETGTSNTHRQYHLIDKTCQMHCGVGYSFKGVSCQSSFSYVSPGVCSGGWQVTKVNQDIEDCNQNARSEMGITHFAYSNSTGECAYYSGSCETAIPKDSWSSFRIQSMYEIARSGVCTRPIPTSEECLSAARELGLDPGADASVVTQDGHSNGSNPVCYYTQSSLRFSSVFSNVSCSDSRICLCRERKVIIAELTNRRKRRKRKGTKTTIPVFSPAKHYHAAVKFGEIWCLQAVIFALMCVFALSRYCRPCRKPRRTTFPKEGSGSQI